MIRKQGDSYYVYSKRGKRLGGPYQTEESAKERLEQIEYFKAKRRREGKWVK